MNGSSATLLVAVAESNAIIKVNGRANFSSSIPFKTVVSELRERGSARFLVDLTECSTMDSTFLGVLAGLAMELGGGKPSNNAPPLELCNANARVLDLLENLGIAHLLHTVQTPQNPEASFTPVPVDGAAPSKEQLSQTCLQAHETLMQINPANIPKFKEVTRFLIEDLKKTQS